VALSGCDKGRTASAMLTAIYFDRCQVTNLLLPPEIAAVAEKFTLANGY
jgi:hypothetical protein